MTTNIDGVDAPNVDDQEQAAADAAQQKALNSKSLEDQLKALQEINAEAIKTRDSAKRKLRELESTNAKTIAEAANYKDRLINKSVTESLRNALADAGALSIDTALKLIDKKAIKLNEEFEADQESIKLIVEGLTQSDSILFKAKEELKDDKKEDKPLPSNPIKRPGSKTTQEDSFSIALKAAKSRVEIEALLRAHNKA